MTATQQSIGLGNVTQLRSEHNGETQLHGDGIEFEYCGRRYRYQWFDLGYNLYSTDGRLIQYRDGRLAVECRPTPWPAAPTYRAMTPDEAALFDRRDDLAALIAPRRGPDDDWDRTPRHKGGVL